MSRRLFAWYRAFVDAIMEPKWARTPGDTRLPRAQAVSVSLVPVVYLDTSPVVSLRLKCTTAARSSHVPRAGKILAGARGHGLGLSQRLS